jgi:predicted  nucleic acid-binding Zn-ribbon protein
MTRDFSSIAQPEQAVDWVRAASVATVTAIVLFVVLVAIGFTLLVARRRSAGPGADHARQQKANILLVRVDDAIKAGEDELGFAVAQFGEETTKGYAAAIAAARQLLAEAFALQQRLDDSTPDSTTQKNAWNARIIQLCQRAQASLDAQQEQFDRMRRLEKNAPANLAAVRESISALSTRLTAAEETASDLESTYAPSAIASVAENLDAARQQLTRARALADAAGSSLSAQHGTAAADSIRDAEDGVVRADRLLDAIDSAAATRGTAAGAVADLLASTRVNAEEARATRDAPADADSAENVGRALTLVDRVVGELSAPRQRTDPVSDLNRLRDANAALDTAMASARNQQRRLDGARTALTGALVAARSQISATSDFIDTRRGAIGSEARTRLAEARRLLTLAEAESDPVTALDTARRSATYSRDADALARYDVMGQPLGR